MNDESGKANWQWPAGSLLAKPWGNGSGETFSSCPVHAQRGCRGRVQTSSLSTLSTFWVDKYKINPPKEYGTVLLHEPLNERAGLTSQEVEGKMSGLRGENVGRNGEEGLW